MTGLGGGRVGALLLSPCIRPGTVSATPYNRYSLLASIEDFFGLPRLGYAATTSSTSARMSSMLTRRSLLKAAVAGTALAGMGPQLRSLAASYSRPRFGPGDRPYPHLRTGTESIPQIQHLVVLMMENHSFDDHGGYYDHVAPVPAVRPDGIVPAVGADTYGDLYSWGGFRVPTVVVSPWARANHVSHTVYDHTSVLRFIETKWNLPALSYRDANVNNMVDCLDLRAPAFSVPPSLPPAPLPGGAAACVAQDPAGQ